MTGQGRRLTDAERRLVVNALRLSSAQTLQVAAAWDPEDGNIPRALGGLRVDDTHRAILESAQDQDHLASTIAESDCVIVAEHAKPPREVTPDECPNCCKTCRRCGTACRC